MTEHESSSSSSSWNCLGTRMIVVVGDNDTSDITSNEAMLIVHNEIFPSIENIEDKDGVLSSTTTTTTKKSPPAYSSRLKLILCTDRNQIYCHIIDIGNDKQVKFKSNDDRSKLGNYLLQDDRDHPNIKIEFGLFF